MLLDTNLNAYLGERALNTLVLFRRHAAVAIPLSLAIGVVAAVKRDGALDHTCPASCCSLSGSPSSWWHPARRVLRRAAPVVPRHRDVPARSDAVDWLESLVLPVATLLIVALPHTIRLVRGSMIEVLDSEYVEAIRLRGIPESRVVWKHALPNALGPAIQVIALNAAWLVGGIVIVENVFNYPGLGQAVVSALLAHDVPVIESIVCLMVLAYVAITTLADVANISSTRGCGSLRMSSPASPGRAGARWWPRRSTAAGRPSPCCGRWRAPAPAGSGSS